MHLNIFQLQFSSQRISVVDVFDNVEILYQDNLMVMYEYLHLFRDFETSSSAVFRPFLWGYGGSIHLFRLVSSIFRRSCSHA